MGHWVKKFQAILSRFNAVMNLSASSLWIIIMLITAYEVIARYAFNAPTIWSLEISRYAMLIAVFLGTAYTLEMRKHIKVDLVVMRLSPGKRRIVNIISSVLAIIFFTTLVWKTAESAWIAHKFGWESATLLAIPLSPIYVVVLIGSFFLFLQGIAQFFQLLAEVN